MCYVFKYSSYYSLYVAQQQLHATDRTCVTHFISFVSITAIKVQNDVKLQMAHLYIHMYIHMCSLKQWFLCKQNSMWYVCGTWRKCKCVNLVICCNACVLYEPNCILYICTSAFAFSCSCSSCRRHSAALCVCHGSCCMLSQPTFAVFMH